MRRACQIPGMMNGPVVLPSTRRYPVNTGFTLVELLVVISIITLLIAVLLPALSSARQAVLALKCSSNMRQLGMAYFSYISDNRGWTTDPTNTLDANNAWTRGAGVGPYYMHYSNKLVYYSYIGTTAQVSGYRANVAAKQSKSLEAFICPNEPGFDQKPLSYFPNSGLSDAGNYNGPLYGVGGQGNFTFMGTSNFAIMSRPDAYNAPSSLFFLIEKNGGGVASSSDSYRILNQNGSGWATYISSPQGADGSIGNALPSSFLHANESAKNVLFGDMHVKNLKREAFYLPGAAPKFDPSGTAVRENWYSGPAGNRTKAIMYFGKSGGVWSLLTY